MSLCYDRSRLTWNTFTAWLLAWRKSEYIFLLFFFFDGYKQKSINIVKDWKDCKCVCVCVCVPYLMSQMDFIPQVFYRAELRLAGGDLPTSFLLPRSQQPQRDFWRLQRESQVWKSELWHWMRAKMWWQLLWKRWRNQPWENEIGQSCDEDCRKTIKDESGESRRGESRRELLGRLCRYLVFHRHFSKSDQGHQQQHPLPLSLCSVQLLLSSLLIFTL